MNISYEAAALIIGVLSLVGGTAAWYFASRLGERKENIEQTMDIRYMKEDIKDLKSKCEKLLALEERFESYVKFKN